MSSFKQKLVCVLVFMVIGAGLHAAMFFTMFSVLIFIGLMSCFCVLPFKNEWMFFRTVCIIIAELCSTFVITNYLLQFANQIHPNSPEPEFALFMESILLQGALFGAIVGVIVSIFGMKQISGRNLGGTLVYLFGY